MIQSMHLVSQVCDGIRSGFFYKNSTELRVMTILGPENTLGYVADLTDN